MVKHKTLTEFATLFAGRGEAYFMSTGKNGVAIYEHVTLRTFARHLSSDLQIGTYPVLDNCKCRWGCIDIDEDNIELAQNIHTVWTYEGIPAWIERSRSKGYHIWTFSKEWIDAQVMRGAGLYVAHIAEMYCDVKLNEVNPKNTNPNKTGKKLINTVRLPYPATANNGRMTVVDPYTLQDIPLSDFCHEAYSSAVVQDEFQRVCSLFESWRKEQNSLERFKGLAQSIGYSTSKAGNYGTSRQTAVQILQGKMTAVNGERDNQFYTMARFLHGQGIEYDEAARSIQRAWEEHTEDNTDFPLEIAMEKLQRVYGP